MCFICSVTFWTLFSFFSLSMFWTSVDKMKGNLYSWNNHLNVIYQLPSSKILHLKCIENMLLGIVLTVGSYDKGNTNEFWLF